MVSFDVVSLFTHVSKNSVCKSISKRWKDIKEFTSVPKEHFLSLVEFLEFLFNNNFFQYNKEIYKQLEGCAMGAPASPIFADLVMNDILESFEDEVKFLIPFLFLYVDDNMTALPETEIDNCLKTLNNIDDKIRFTCEIENNNSLPFLDLLLVRSDEKVLTDLYSKPISSDRLLNFKSHHPLHQKIAIVKQCKYKIDNLCSDPFREKNVISLKQKLRSNNYPDYVINSVFNNAVANNHSTNQNQTGEENERSMVKYLKMPYHNVLAPKINNLFHYPNTKVAYYNLKSNKRFFGNVKDRAPPKDQSNLVYEIDCQCGKTYIGQTMQKLNTRLQQHRNGTGKTGLTAHIKETGHTMDFDNVKILDKEPILQKRMFLEFAHITARDQNKILNLITDYNEGSTIYSNAIQKFK